MSVIEYLLRQPGESGNGDTDLATWWKGNQGAGADFAALTDQAIVVSSRSLIPAHAFYTGYQFALRHMFPSRAGKAAAICISEKGGNHPAAIEARLEDQRMSGVKTFVTAADMVQDVLVAVTTGQDADGRSRLRLVHVRVGDPGIRVEQDDKRTPFIPEVRRGRLLLEDTPVAAEQILEGDAHNDYSKPFSSLEGLYIRLAMVSWLSALGRARDWPHDLRETLLARVWGLRSLILADPEAAPNPIILAGLLRPLAEIAGELSEGDLLPANLREIWRRDRGLLAGNGRLDKIRLEKAWSAFD